MDKQQISDSAITALLAKMRPQMDRLFKVFEIPPSDAEDLLQEILTSLLIHWQKIERLEGWMLSALRNQCFQHLQRRYRSRLQIEPEELDRLPSHWDVSRLRADLLLDVWHLAATLPRRQQKLLYLRYAAGLTPREVAEKLGYSPASISKCTILAIKRLKENGGLP